MPRPRNLGIISTYHAAQDAVQAWFDNNDLSGSAISQVFESRLDEVEDGQQALGTALNQEIQRSKAADTTLTADLLVLSSSALASRSGMFTAIQNNITALSSSVSSSIALLSASIGAAGGITVTGTSELTFDGDTLLTDANIYLSGASNNLYINGTNEQGNPAKYEFSVVSGGVFIDEVPESDFGDSVEDPWFKFDGDTLLTHADIYVSGSGNYLYLNGTNREGEYAKYYFDVISGSVFVFESGSN